MKKNLLKTALFCSLLLAGATNLNAQKEVSQSDNQNQYEVKSTRSMKIVDYYVSVSKAGDSFTLPVSTYEYEVRGYAATFDMVSPATFKISNYYGFDGGMVDKGCIGEVAYSRRGSNSNEVVLLYRIINK